MIPWKREKGHTKAAYYLTLFIFGILTGLPTLAYAIFVAHFQLWQWIYIRLLYNVLWLGGGYFFGELREIFRAFLVQNSQSRVRQGLADIVALMVYSLPLYIAVGWYMGAGMRQIQITLWIYAVDFVLLGWFFDPIIDRVEKFLGRFRKRNQKKNE